MESPQGDLLIDASHVSRQSILAEILSQMVTYLICDLRKEFFKRVQASFR